jgi:anti-sigma B factor antagonist
MITRPALEFHKVFRVEFEGDTAIVVPPANPISFRYNEIHLEANAVIRIIDDPDVKNIIIDFTNVDYASSMIIGALIRMARKVTNHGGQAVMCHANGNMLEILNTMNLLKLWPHYDTREIALAAVEEL